MKAVWNKHVMQRVKLIVAIVLAVVTVPESTVGQESDTGWAQAQAGRVLEFPADHASHPDHRLEWWYYTGNLEGVDGRRFGYQVTFFRVGIDRAPENPSVWSVRDLFMAHLAVTDLDRGQHLVSERAESRRRGVGRRPNGSTGSLERRLASRSRRHEPTSYAR